MPTEIFFFSQAADTLQHQKAPPVGAVPPSVVVGIWIRRARTRQGFIQIWETVRIGINRCIKTSVATVRDAIAVGVYKSIEMNYARGKGRRFRHVPACFA